MDEISKEEEYLIELLKSLDNEFYEDKEKENVILTIVMSAVEDDAIEEATELVERNKELALKDVFRMLFDEGILEKVEIEE